MLDERQLEQILLLSKESYDQERKREDTINKKADNLMKYMGIYLTALNVILPVAERQGIINSNIVRLCYLWIVVPAIISLLLSIFGQAYSQEYSLPKGRELLELFFQNVDGCFESYTDCLSVRISVYDDSTEIMNRSNGIKVFLVYLAYAIYALTILALSILVYKIFFTGG